MRRYGGLGRRLQQPDPLTALALLSRIRKECHCWIWQGAVNDSGYGVMRRKSRYYYVHRLAYALFCGAIRKGDTVHHECHVARCVNPLHLTLLPNGENVAEGNCRRPKKPKPQPKVPF